MKYKNDSFWSWASFGVVSVFVTMLLLGNQDLEYIPDLRFLYNRAVQMCSCMSDGNIPFFFYDDFGGVGYGSSFFYGYLTLYPFLPFVGMGIKVFLNMYIFVTVVLTYLGSLYLAKCFCENYKFVAVMYIGSCFCVQYFYIAGIYPNLLATALGFFFIARCVRFFRDRESFLPASVLFWLVLHTHTLSAVLCFISCVFVFIMYFDIKRWRGYLKFFLVTCFLCSYFILNMLWHGGVLTRLSYINSHMLEVAKSGDEHVIFNYQSTAPIGGVVYTILMGVTGGYKLLNFGEFGVCLYGLRRGRKSWRVWAVLVLVVLCFILCSKWLLINDLVLLPFQFPVRFVPYMLMAFLLVSLRGVEPKKWMLLLLLPELLLNSFMVKPFSEEYKESISNELSCQVMNGEYVDDSFIWDFDVFYDESSRCYNGTEEYDWEEDAGVVTVYGVSSGRVHIPKLWYRGYVCDEGFECVEGYSQFVDVLVSEEWHGDIRVWYQHPYWLQILDFVTVLSVFMICVINTGIIFWKRGKSDV